MIDFNRFKEKILPKRRETEKAAEDPLELFEKIRLTMNEFQARQLVLLIDNTDQIWEAMQSAEKGDGKREIDLKVLVPALGTLRENAAAKSPVFAKASGVKESDYDFVKRSGLDKLAQSTILTRIAREHGKKNMKVWVKDGVLRWQE